jgi:hypothetical protein
MEAFMEDVEKFSQEIREKIQKTGQISDEDLKILFLLNTIEEEKHEK